jgi:hypothetical protein
MSDYAKLDSYLEKNLEKSIAELSKLVAQPSISAQGIGLKECASLVADMLRARGFAAEIMDTEGAPVVFAERKGKSAKTLLFYNHYDVQPPEPLELWETPPFEPSLREGKLYGRGVSDDKAHIVSRLHAIDSILETDGELPCNIKFIIEGEEETSSVHLHDFIRANKDKLKADACIWEFGGVDHRDVPMQYLGLRGICYVELSVESLGTDVHSGVGGSILPNAAWRLVWALSTLKGPDEHIRIPGFYDHIVQPTARDRELMDALPDVADEYKRRFGVKRFIKGLTGGTDLKMEEVFAPTCTICGLTSGYQGPGSKTVRILTLKVSAMCRSNSSAVNRLLGQTQMTALSEPWSRLLKRCMNFPWRSSPRLAAPVPAIHLCMIWVCPLPRPDLAIQTRALMRPTKTSASIYTSSMRGTWRA